MAYLSYEQYLEMGGDLDEAAFRLAELKARRRIDGMTQGRVAGMAAVPPEVAAAMMEIMAVDGVYGPGAQARSPVATSFNTDGYSERYGGAEGRTAAIERRLRAEIASLLDGVADDAGVPLLYAGVAVAGRGVGPADG